ncbi:MAG TPA: SURF1 family protein [Stellaceae bacterium]|nr:SURF1 family protein [Stellaceae bacterium]
MSAKPSIFWPSFFSLLAFFLLIALGTWQVQRLGWKERLIAERHAAVTAPPIALPKSLAEAQRLEYRHITATGTFLNDRELFLGATDEEGHAGYHVITPLRLADGGVLLVDRGFIPEDRKSPSSRAAGELSGEVTVTGLVRLAPSSKPAWFIPDNSVERNYWIWVDIPAMARADHLDRVYPFYMDADATPNPGGLPRGGQTRLELPNNHLQYAITWYSLAGALVVIYIIFIRRRLAERGAAA